MDTHTDTYMSHTHQHTLSSTNTHLQTQKHTHTQTHTHAVAVINSKLNWTLTKIVCLTAGVFNTDSVNRVTRRIKADAHKYTKTGIIW